MRFVSFRYMWHPIWFQKKRACSLQLRAIFHVFCNRLRDLVRARSRTYRASRSLSSTWKQVYQERWNNNWERRLVWPCQAWCETRQMRNLFSKNIKRVETLRYTKYSPLPLPPPPPPPFSTAGYETKQESFIINNLVVVAFYTSPTFACSAFRRK